MATNGVLVDCGNIGEGEFLIDGEFLIGWEFHLCNCTSLFLFALRGGKKTKCLSYEQSVPVLFILICQHLIPLLPSLHRAHSYPTPLRSVQVHPFSPEPLNSITFK